MIKKKHIKILKELEKTSNVVQLTKDEYKSLKKRIFQLEILIDEERLERYNKENKDTVNRTTGFFYHHLSPVPNVTYSGEKPVVRLDTEITYKRY